MTFTSSFENNASTRTVLDGTNVLWQPGDAGAIGVLFVNYDDESLTCYIGDKTQIPSGCIYHSAGEKLSGKTWVRCFKPHTFSGDCCGYGIKLRKTVMMPVLIRSENMAPMIGTMMKGTVA